MCLALPDWLTVGTCPFSEQFINEKHARDLNPRYRRECRTGGLIQKSQINVVISKANGGLRDRPREPPSLHFQDRI